MNRPQLVPLLIENLEKGVPYWTARLEKARTKTEAVFWTDRLAWAKEELAKLRAQLDHVSD